ncbi:MAG: response regulator [Candidatus Omnitrophica bacterium]|nr:response regulator [Candidatus Omnitrophota bacterium]
MWDDIERKKILIVDDEEKFLAVTKKNLEKSGPYEVRIESRVSEVIPAVKEFKPDLIILDVMMPDRRGSEIAYEIRNTDKIKQIPILFLTATAMKGQKELFGGLVDGLPFTIKPTVSKPVSTADLIKAIESQLPKPTDE